MDKSLTLLDHTQTITSITCKCGKEQKTDEDAMEAIDTFYDAGWRAKKGLVQCPSCVLGITIVIDKRCDTAKDLIKENGC